MLKNKVKSLQKEINQLSNKKRNGVYFVDFWDEVFVIRTSGDKKPIFQGSHEEYKEFTRKYEKSVFIIDDIPRSEKKPTLLEMAE